MDNFGLLLLSAFLFDINPLYVVVFSLIWKLLRKELSSKVGIKSDVISVALSKKVDIEDGNTKRADPSREYDYVLIGNNIGTHFTAALLSKAGFSCCIVCCPLNYPPLEVHPMGWAAPIPIQYGRVTNVTLYQNLLDMAQEIDPITRVIFKPIGSADSLHTHSVLHSSHARYSKDSVQKLVVIPLFTGSSALASILASRSSSDRSSLVRLFRTISKCFGSIKTYLTMKISTTALEVPKDFLELSTHTCKSIIQQNRVGNSLFESISMLSIFGSGGEPTPAEHLCVLSLASAISSCEEGIFVPKGGLSCVLKLFNDAVLASSGVILKDASIEDLIIEKNTSEQTFVKGVQLLEDAPLLARRGVFSGLGILCTYCKLLPPSMVDEKTRENLKDYVEGRPKMSVIFEVSGTMEYLNLSDTEYLECEERKISDSTEHEDINVLVQSYVKLWCPTVQDDILSKCYGGRSIIIVEMCADDSIVKVAEFSGFSGIDCDKLARTDKKGGPMLYFTPKIDHSKKNIGHAVALSDSTIRKIKERAERKVLAVYPRCRGNILKIHVVPPFVGGHRLSANIKRYTSEFKLEDQIVRSLYFCSEDLGVPGMQGELQAGYMGVCSALNYSCPIIGSKIPSDKYRCNG